MIHKYLLPVIALLGAAYAASVAAAGSQPAPVAQPVSDPSRPPFASYISGSGMIEAQTRNIAIGAPLPRLVKEVLVKVGDDVKAGAPLFQLSDRVTRAELEVRRAALAGTRARLARLEAAPRPEGIPPAEARVAELEAVLADLRQQVALWDSVADKRAVSAEELGRKKYAAQAAESRLGVARAELALLKAGSWKPDLEVARAEVAEAEAQVVVAETELDRLTVRAPVDGTVLQVNIRPGEFAAAEGGSSPLMLFGGTARLHVRVDVDENDAWRFRRGAAAVAFVRGNREFMTPLRFEWVEPFVVPKRALTGETTERVDTRVMQAVYSFDRGTLPVYLGQQMDLFIEAPNKAPAAPAGNGDKR